MSLHPTLNPKPFFTPLSIPQFSYTLHHHTFTSSPFSYKPPTRTLKPLPLFSVSSTSDSNSNPNPKSQAKPKPKRRNSKNEIPQTQSQAQSSNEDEEVVPRTIPRKPRRGRRSEAAAVEDFVRDKLEETFESIRQQTSDVSEEDKGNVLKDRIDDSDNNKKKSKKKGVVVEEEDSNWPLDADIGWGIRASEYFDKHSIKNVVGEGGVEIDWEGEVDNNYVKEINCLEWESFAFHPSPLIVLVFERYNRADDNWKLLKELEKAIKVYWDAKDRLPPRTVKIDINIERDLAYALKVRECPQLLFLRGNKILYREKGIPTADELILMIAHFYYNAKKPSCIDDAALSPP